MEINLNDTFIREVELKINEVEKILRIYQLNVGDVGCVVWDAALVLSHFITTKHCRDKYITGKNIIELGSGTGIVGLCSYAAGASNVLMTDLPLFIPLIKLNIDKNFTSKCPLTAATLDWMDKDNTMTVLDKTKEGFNCVLIADCVYYKDSVEPLVNVIENILKHSSDDTVAICSYEERTVGNKQELQKYFQELILRKNFTINFVPLNDMHPLFRSDDIKIMIIAK